MQRKAKSNLRKREEKKNKMSDDTCLDVGVCLSQLAQRRPTAEHPAGTCKAEISKCYPEKAATGFREMRRRLSLASVEKSPRQKPSRELHKSATKWPTPSPISPWPTRRRSLLSTERRRLVFASEWYVEFFSNCARAKLKQTFANSSL